MQEENALNVLISDLLQVTISVEAPKLERLLDALATLPFHINPDLVHREAYTEVRFPAYTPWIESIRGMLDAYGFDGTALEQRPMLDVLTTA
jgi:hypothetical protein